MAVERPLVVVITGPTASGKSDVALELAERFPVSLISVDSAMVYRGMDVGTAKPGPELLTRHPHALVDIRDPSEPYSAAEFLTDADEAVHAAIAAGRVPVLVGGTMLYLRVFREGLSDLPPADPEVRASLAAEAETAGWPALHRRLADVDPAAAAGIHPRNGARIQRALEVHQVSGRPISAWWADSRGRGAESRLGVRLEEVALMPSRRADLAERIGERFRGMLDQGLVDEVAALKARGDLSPALPSMRSVGYRQVWDYLDGYGDLEDLAERGAAATRQLAKRQLTWLGRWPHVVRFEAAAGAAAHRIARHVQLEIS